MSLQNKKITKTSDATNSKSTTDDTSAVSGLGMPVEQKDPRQIIISRVSKLNSKKLNFNKTTIRGAPMMKLIHGSSSPIESDSNFCNDFGTLLPQLTNKKTNTKIGLFGLDLVPDAKVDHRQYGEFAKGERYVVDETFDCPIEEFKLAANKLFSDNTSGANVFSQVLCNARFVMNNVAFFYNYPKHEEYIRPANMEYSFQYTDTNVLHASHDQNEPCEPALKRVLKSLKKYKAFVINALSFLYEEDDSLRDDCQSFEDLLQLIEPDLQLKKFNSFRPTEFEYFEGFICDGKTEATRNATKREFGFEIDTGYRMKLKCGKYLPQEFFFIYFPITMYNSYAFASINTQKIVYQERAYFSHAAFEALALGKDSVKMLLGCTNICRVRDFYRVFWRLCGAKCVRVNLMLKTPAPETFHSKRTLEKHLYPTFDALTSFQKTFYNTLVDVIECEEPIENLRFSLCTFDSKWTSVFSLTPADSMALIITNRVEQLKKEMDEHKQQISKNKRSKSPKKDVKKIKQ